MNALAEANRLLAAVVDPVRRETLREEFNERAGIVFYGGGQTLHEAEALALSELRAKLGSVI